MASGIHLVSMTWRGVVFFRYVTPLDPGTANHNAGVLMDSLADRYGNGFGYQVEPLPYIGTHPTSPDALPLAMEEYETGAWPCYKESK